MTVSERDWEVERPGFTLKGTVCLPASAGTFPVALLLPGSGNVDRDGNVRGRGPSIYAKLAHELAKFGLASYRYDKRGSGASGGKFLETTHHDLVDDASAVWTQLLDSAFCKPGERHLIGHSEGTVVAAAISQLTTHKPKSIVQICPFSDGAEAMLIKQADQIERELPSVPGLLGILLRLLNTVTGPYGKKMRALLTHVRTLEGGTVRLGASRVSAVWLRELIELDVSSLYRGIPCPVLLLSGEKDLQCTPESAEELAQLVPSHAEHHVVKDMIHHLSACEGAPALFDLRDIDSLPLSPDLLSHLQDWLTREAFGICSEDGGHFNAP